MTSQRRPSGLKLTFAGDPLGTSELRSVRLQGPAPAIPLSSVTSPAEDLQTWTFRLAVTRLGDQRPLPKGTYRVLVGSGIASSPLEVDPYGEVPLPWLADTGAHLVSAGVTPAGILRIHVDVPVSIPERGPWAQQRLIEVRNGWSGPLEPAIVFCGTEGPSRLDLVAVADEVRRQRPDIPVYWEQTDPSAPAPEHARSLIVGSRGWHRWLARAAAVCSGAPAGPALSPDIGQARALILDGSTAGRLLSRNPGDRIDSARWAVAALTDSRPTARIDRDVDAATDDRVLLVSRLPGPGLPTAADRLTEALTEARHEMRRVLELEPDEPFRVLVADGRHDLVSATLLQRSKELPDGWRLVVWAARQHRLPRSSRIVDATGWLRPLPLIVAANEIVLPEGAGEGAWRVLDAAPPGLLVPADRRARLKPVTQLALVKTWSGPDTRGRARRLDRVVSILLAGIDQRREQRLG